MTDLRSALREVAGDALNDARNFDGQPFNGGTVGRFFGYQAAAVANLAGLVERLLDRIDGKTFPKVTDQAEHADPPQSRVWTLPDEPGPEVQAVRDADGEIWHRAGSDWRRGDSDPVMWALLMVYAPLTDATAEHIAATQPTED